MPAGSPDMFSPPKKQIKKEATDLVTSHKHNNFLKPIASASLRWHYPNQVLGRRSHLPLSLYYKLPFRILFLTVYHVFFDIARENENFLRKFVLRAKRRGGILLDGQRVLW